MLKCDADRVGAALVRHGAGDGVGALLVLFGGSPTGDSTSDAVALVAASEARSCERVAALYISARRILGLEVDPDVMTDALKEAFPVARVGARHAPFYFSRARTGQLVGLPPGITAVDLPPIKRGSRRKGPPPPPKGVQPVASPPAQPEPPPPPPPPPSDDPAALSREELIDWLRSRGVSSDGRTVELIRRAIAHRGDSAAPPSAG